MSVANPLWGAPRIHGELLKLGIDVGQTTVAKYMARKRRPPSQGWKTFLRNHADGIASIDLFVVPTISFGCCMRFWSCGIRGGSLYELQEVKSIFRAAPNLTNLRVCKALCTRATRQRVLLRILGTIASSTWPR